MARELSEPESPVRVPTIPSSADGPSHRRTSRGQGPAQASTGTTSVAIPMRLLRFPAVRDRTGLSRSTIWRLERRGEFPRHRRISANAVAWVEEEVASWIRAKSVRSA
jgi:prophage regulatory protein